MTDRASYQVAVDHLYNIRHELSIKDKPTILIANKIDLVRKRKVSKEGILFLKYFINSPDV
jgi:50S ribosomal subunit-associated GTPase HflX